MHDTDRALAALIAAHGPARALELPQPIASSRVMQRAAHLARVERARELLRRRVPRQAIAMRLAAADGISRASAYRAIGAALKLSHEPRDSETATRQDALA